MAVLFGWNTGDVDSEREVSAYPHLHLPLDGVFLLLGTLGRSPAPGAQAIKGTASFDGKGGHRYSADC